MSLLAGPICSTGKLAARAQVDAPSALCHGSLGGHAARIGSRSSCKALRTNPIRPRLPCYSTGPIRSPIKASSEQRSKGATKGLNIVFISAEVAPWSKTGGLGDVLYGLPIQLATRGHRVMTVAPRYDQYADAWDTSVAVDIDGETVRYFHTHKQGVDRVWVDHPSFLAKVWGRTGAKLYGQKSGSDFSDNQKRFMLFNKAAIQALTVLPFSPGEDSVIVANDWHTSTVPVLIKDVYQPQGKFTKTKVAYCIHNIAFQGRFWADSWKDLGLPETSYDKFAFEDGYARIWTEEEPDFEGPLPQGRYKKLNWMKAGFLSADKLLTVSPNYAAEIMADEAKGVELNEVLKAAGGIEGIVNGMDTDDWNPAVDKFLDVKYTAATVAEGKAIAKETLQAELGLPVDPDVPLFGFIGRLEEQKGVDILLEALPAILKKGNCQVVVLGTGKKGLEAQVKVIEKQFPKTARGVVQFSAPLAHQITAGADFMLVPSRFEPCGLIQLHAMQYGTVPIVASTGGLVDTVSEGVTGFHIGAMDPDDLLEEDAEAIATTVQRAAETFHAPAFATMRAKCIGQELSWEKPARKWEAVLEELVHGTGGPATQKKAAVSTPAQKITDPALAARDAESDARLKRAQDAAVPRPEAADTSAGPAKPQVAKAASAGRFAGSPSSNGAAPPSARTAGSAAPASAARASLPASPVSSAQPQRAAAAPSPSSSASTPARSVPAGPAPSKPAAAASVASPVQAAAPSPAAASPTPASPIKAAAPSPAPAAAKPTAGSAASPAKAASAAEDTAESKAAPAKPVAKSRAARDAAKGSGAAKPAVKDSPNGSAPAKSAPATASTIKADTRAQANKAK